MNRSSAWTLAKIILAILLLGIVVQQVNLDNLTQLWQRLSLPWLIPSILCFYAIIVVMARRSWNLIEPRIPFHQMLGLVVIQTAIGNLVATGAGLASYIAILRGKHQVRLQQGLVSILLAKLGDLLALLVLLSISSVLTWEQIGTVQPVILLLLLGMFCIIASIAGVILARARAVGLIRNLLRSFHLERFARIQRLVYSLETLTVQDPRRLQNMVMLLLGYSSILLLIQLAFSYCNMQLFAIPVDIPQMAFILSLISLIAFVPIQVFGGLGVSEISGLFIYGLFVPDQAYLAAFLIGARLYAYALNALLLPYLLIESRFEKLATVTAHDGEL